MRGFPLQIPNPRVKSYFFKKVNGDILIIKHNSYKQSTEERFGLDDH